MEHVQDLLKQKGLVPEVVQLFQRRIYDYYSTQARELPWRATHNPYHILISEFMLQQTQVSRVLVKYERFVIAFPDFKSLSRAPLREVLEVWQGLGYNRRAMALQKTAQIVEIRFKGKLPDQVEILKTFPGIGEATASAIAAFAFGKPVTLIETNIRRVFIHFFFRDQDRIKDSQILPFVKITMDTSHPREWYYALMDYGAMLGKEFSNPNKRSAHYRKQSPFHGSDRQIRGLILKAMMNGKGFSEDEIHRELPGDPERIKRALFQLQKEGFIKNERGQLVIQ
jgi:A/G-specific adenine glycosylase